jgi:hypothetical protein
MIEIQPHRRLFEELYYYTIVLFEYITKMSESFDPAVSQDVCAIKLMEFDLTDQYRNASYFLAQKLLYAVSHGIYLSLLQLYHMFFLLQGSGLSRNRVTSPRYRSYHDMIIFLTAPVGS